MPLPLALAFPAAGAAGRLGAAVLRAHRAAARLAPGQLARRRRRPDLRYGGLDRTSPGRLRRVRLACSNRIFTPAQEEVDFWGEIVALQEQYDDDVKIDGTEYVILREDEVLGVLNNKK